MQVTIKGTSPTDTLDEGEVRTVELTPYVRNLIRNGLAVQVPRAVPDPAEVKPAPAKKVPAKKTVAKKALAKAAKEFDGTGILYVPSSLPDPGHGPHAEETHLVEQLRDALADEE